MRYFFSILVGALFLSTFPVHAASKKVSVIEFRELDARAKPMVTSKEVRARHVLICFVGAVRCEKSRTKEEALQEIKKIRDSITAKNFAETTARVSNDPTVATNGGDLGWVKQDGAFVEAFTDAALRLRKGEISQPVETEFGYHLILATGVRAPKWKKTELNRTHLRCAQLEFDPKQNEASKTGIVRFELTTRGTALFSKITKRNFGKRLAIFLDGKSIIDTNGDHKITSSDLYAPVVEEHITKGKVLITGFDDIAQARSLLRKLSLDLCKPFTPPTYKKGKNI